MIPFEQHVSYTDDDIKLPYSLRTRHAYLIGRSGSGKTTAIQNMVFQDIAYGCGVGVLAPEQELITEEILPFIPEERMDDVVYVNPADLEYPIPLNPLHLGKWEDIDRTVDDLITVFGRLTNDLTPRMREILYHTFYALVEREGSTLLDVEILLDRTDPSIRNEIIYTTKNPRTARFFQSVFPTLSRDACLPIYSRIGQIISPQRVRSLLCQPGRSFNFREAMDDGKILLFNLSDGILGEQTSQMLGQLIVSKIQMAVFSRADTPARQRRPFFLYLDEFQTFTGTSQTAYSKLLSRGRKYSFGTVLANQNTGQLPSALLEDILGNVSTLIAFNLSSNDAAKFSKEFVMPGGGESLRLPQDFLLQLPVGEAWGKIGQTVFPLKTQLLTQPANPIRAKEIIERSRMNYGGKVSREEWLMRIEESMPIDLERGQDFIVIEDDDDDDDVDPGQIF
jgi:hypothetical protein